MIEKAIAAATRIRWGDSTPARKPPPSAPRAVTTLNARLPPTSTGHGVRYLHVCVITASCVLSPSSASKTNPNVDRILLQSKSCSPQVLCGPMIPHALAHSTPESHRADAPRAHAHTTSPSQAKRPDGSLTREPQALAPRLPEQESTGAQRAAFLRTVRLLHDLTKLRNLPG